MHHQEHQKGTKYCISNNHVVVYHPHYVWLTPEVLHGGFQRNWIRQVHIPHK